MSVFRRKIEKIDQSPAYFGDYLQGTIDRKHILSFHAINIANDQTALYGSVFDRIKITVLAKLKSRVGLWAERQMAAAGGYPTV